MLKLKNIKKLLGDEIYPLWLDNVLAQHSYFIENDKCDSTTVRLISDSFIWGKTPQGFNFWDDIDNDVNARLKEFPWVFTRLPYNKIISSRYIKSYYFRKKEGRTCIAYLLHDGSMQIHAGCFVGSLEEFEGRANAQYPNDEEESYVRHIKCLKELQLKHEL